ncbi:MAG TPA: hypothetical protein VJV79_36765 [Polyangiaceae bacterium]|nr:hypothetical protein [Polyangiaceae bacterium]
MSNVQQKSGARKNTAWERSILAAASAPIQAKTFRELPGFGEAFAALLEDEARGGWWCNYGFPLSQIGDIVAPGVQRIPSRQMLQRFAMAIMHSAPPADGPGHVHLLTPRRPIPANDCEAANV